MALSSQTYTPTEETEVSQWLQTAERLKASPNDSSILDSLNVHLSTRSTLLGTKPSKADVAVYQTLAPTVKAWTPEQRTGEAGHPHVVRLVDFVQNSPLFELSVPDTDKVQVNLDEVLYVKPPVDPKAEKERLKKEKAAAAAAAAAAGGDGGGGGEEKKLVDRTKDAPAPAAAATAGAPATAEGKPQKQKKDKKERQQARQPAAPAAPAVLSPCPVSYTHLTLPTKA